jgi:DNA-binding transcriptional LysR family regulator
MNDADGLESFLKTAEAGSFSAAAGALGLTPAAVSKHVAKLERRLGVRLFQRTTRSLTLTETGHRLYAETAGPARAVSRALETLTERDAQPAGTLRVSVASGFARQFVLPLMPAFLARYPAIRLDWSYDNRRVDLVKEGFDAAIGGGIAPDANVVARQLLPIVPITVASPSYLAAHGTPATPEDLARHDCIRLRSATSGRLREWTFEIDGETRTVPVDGRVILSDVEAVRDAAVAGMGLARVGAYQALPWLDDGRLVRVLAGFPGPGGAVQVYYAHNRLTPPKVRAFVEFLTESFASSPLLARLAAKA